MMKIKLLKKELVNDKSDFIIDRKILKNYLVILCNKMFINF